ncbi:hypothetical protein OG574_09575 [Streptomyces sp. NBC_01445]|nr:hypothetical protein [Streptomyces sp. NBC_01445]WSE03597.1 hypothetical protein OG574_09575 [Streptomyces sp. NBC_01445]
MADLFELLIGTGIRLRDSSAMAMAAYVGFDLEAIFEGELFSEFVLLYMTLHASRFEVGEGQPASACWLDKWRTLANRRRQVSLARVPALCGWQVLAMAWTCRHQAFTSGVTGR